ncbi:MAG: MMPL family transporter [Treponema sp.]|jgi:predicted RND superfamily exporter protein|nr:MMPL family transporter [Treponema sp.]
MEKFYKHPAIIAAVVAAVTLFFAVQLTRAELDNNNMRFIPKGNEARVISEYIDDTFGPSVMILVGLERQYGTVFDAAFLEQVREYARAAEDIPFVKTVNSIMSTRYITGDNESIIVTDLVPEDFTGTTGEIAELKRRIASWDLFRGALVSDDLSATQIVVNLDVKTEDSGLPEVTASLIKIRETAKEMFAGLALVYVTGQPVISATINEAIGTDIVILIPLVVLVVLGVLFFSFRRFTFVALPLLTAIAAVVWTIGAMPLFGIKLSILSTILPVILVSVGSAYGIHVVTHYMEDARNRPFGPEEHRALIFALMRKLIKPVFLAALTTFAGFVSFCFTSIIPMREFGFFASFGVLFSFIVAVTLIPSLLLIRGPRVLKERTKKKKAAGIGAAEIGAAEIGAAEGAGHGGTGTSDAVNRTIGNIFVSIARKRIAVLIGTSLTILVSLYGLSRVIVDNSVIEFFQNETDISRSDRFIRQYFGGSRDLSVVVEADATETLLDPQVLRAVDGLSAYLTERVPEVGKVVGFTDVIKRINQLFNIDESPEGLTASSSSAAAEGGSSGAGFGFGDEGLPAAGRAGFGFGDEGEGGGGSSGDEGLPAAGRAGEEARAEMSRYTAADIIALLDTAAGKSPSINGAELVRELQRLINYNGVSYYEIPAEPARYGKNTQEELQAIISNYLVLLAGGGNLDYSNDPLEPTAIKTMIQLRTTGNNDTKAVVAAIKNYIAVNFPKSVRVLIGGSAIQEGAVTDLIVNAQIISIVISVLMVFIIVALSNRSMAAGFIAAVPLTIAILGNFAVMGFLNIKLNIGTAIIASLAVGIGIDYTIHFIDFFKREYQADAMSANRASGDGFLRRTFIGSGKAILINAVSVGAGLGVLSFSQFRILSQLGALIALSMIITAVVSLTVIPVLLTTIKPKFIYGGTP